LEIFGDFIVTIETEHIFENYSMLSGVRCVKRRKPAIFKDFGEKRSRLFCPEKGRIVVESNIFRIEVVQRTTKKLYHNFIRSKNMKSQKTEGEMQDRTMATETSKIAVSCRISEIYLRPTPYWHNSCWDDSMT